MECRNVKNGDLLKVMVNDHGRGIGGMQNLHRKAVQR